MGSDSSLWAQTLKSDVVHRGRQFWNDWGHRSRLFNHRESNPGHSRNKSRYRYVLWSGGWRGVMDLQSIVDNWSDITGTFHNHSSLRLFVLLWDKILLPWLFIGGGDGVSTRIDNDSLGQQVSWCYFGYFCTPLLALPVDRWVIKAVNAVGLKQLKVMSTFLAQILNLPPQSLDFFRCTSTHKELVKCIFHNAPTSYERDP